MSTEGISIAKYLLTTVVNMGHGSIKFINLPGHKATVHGFNADSSNKGQMPLYHKICLS